jgi:hypothetical protein
MEISKEQLIRAAAKVGVSEQQSEILWVSLVGGVEESTASAFSKFIYYFGALIVISAMTWLLGLSWDWFNGGAIFLIAIAYATIFTFLGARLWKKKEYKTPAGLLITMAVSMTPLAIYGLETYLNIWPQEPEEHYRDFFHVIRGSWIFMELGTIATGILALRFFLFHSLPRRSFSLPGCLRLISSLYWLERTLPGG